MAKRDLTSILKQAQATREPESPESLSKTLGLELDLARDIVDISCRAKVDIVSDLPANEDAFGFDALVRTLSSVILSDSTQTPIAISIDGEWGTGKTSILKMMEVQARMLGFPCIWLNAWNLETPEKLIAAVASEIYSESKSSKQSREDLITNHLVDWISKAVVTVGIGAIRLMPAMGVETMIADAVVDARDKLKRSGGVLKASQERQMEISEIASIVTTRQSFEQLVRILLEDSGTKNSRLIVFIDDIDRALPDQIASVLKNLKLILEMPQCVFVLAMDADIVAHSIENHYRLHNQNAMAIGIGEIANADNVTIDQVGHGQSIEEGFGHKYLEKLVQIRVDVPPLTRDCVNAYLRRIGIAREVLEIVHWAPDEEVLNPRRLKRYINWLSISLQLVMSIPRLSEIRNITALRAMALQRDYPEIYDSLVQFVRFGRPVGKSWENHLYARREGLHSGELVEYLDYFVGPELLEFHTLMQEVPMLDMRPSGFRKKTNELD